MGYLASRDWSTGYGSLLEESTAMRMQESHEAGGSAGSQVRLGTAVF